MRALSLSTVLMAITSGAAADQVVLTDGHRLTSGLALAILAMRNSGSNRDVSSIHWHFIAATS